MTYSLVEWTLLGSIKVYLNKKRGLIAVLGIAWVLRVCVIFAFPSLHHPDENFQTFEQAHRLAFGYGLKTWEFEDGMRSLLIPYVFSFLFRIGNAINDSPEFYIYSSRIVLATTSLLAVGFVYSMAEQVSKTHALIVGAVVATWFELVYYSSKPLTEAIAADFLISALAMSSCARTELTPRRCFLIGLFVGIALMVRIHLGVAIVVLWLWICQFDFKARWRPMIVGFAVPIILFGIFDWLTWGIPFYSYVESVKRNLFEGKASTFGVKPWYWLFERYSEIWAGAVPVIISLAIFRTRHSQQWMAVAASILLSHSLIPHKESRFVFSAAICIVLVAAWASADIVVWINRDRPKQFPNWLAPATALIWILVSVSLATAPGFSYLWFKSRDLIAASFWLSHQPDICGLMLLNHSWGQTGGYAFLHRNIPIYEPEPAVSDADAVAAYNYILAERSSIHLNENRFSLQRCFGSRRNEDVCLAKRLGECKNIDGLSPLSEKRRLGENPS